ncbi:MAG: hypothetical protein LBV41_11600 [Cytophagaceae bacterium]|jgi:hypothetical protein|nr:hypothetical protein [Cytophagaceae bacterium]
MLFALSVQLSAQTNQHDRVCVLFTGEKNNEFEFDIINHTQDTLYLFDSYLNNYLYKSKYLHRFDKKNKQCKLSLLPLLPFLSVHYTDVIILGDNKVANKWQVLYHFMTILPNSCHTVTISKNAFYTKDYVYEVYPQKISKFEKTIKFRKSSNNRCSNNITVEFALYKNIDLLTSEKAYYFDEYNFNIQALSYTVLSVLVKL